MPVCLPCAGKDGPRCPDCGNCSHLDCIHRRRENRLNLSSFFRKAREQLLEQTVQQEAKGR